MQAIGSLCVILPINHNLYSPYSTPADNANCDCVLLLQNSARNPLIVPHGICWLSVQNPLIVLVKFANCPRTHTRMAARLLADYPLLILWTMTCYYNAYVLPHLMYAAPEFRRITFAFRGAHRWNSLPSNLRKVSHPSSFMSAARVCLLSYEL